MHIIILYIFIYYLRSKPAQDATKFTVDPNIQQKLNNNDANTIASPRKFKKPEEGQACDTCSS